MSITYKSALAMLARIGSELFEIQSRAEAARNGAAPVPFGRLEPPARR